MRNDGFLDRTRSEAARPSLLTRVPGGLATMIAGLFVVLALAGVAMMRHPYGTYFQDGVFDNYWRSGFAKQLHDMHEAPLGAPRANTAKGVSEVRVLVQMTWGHPAAVHYTFDTTGTTRRAIKLCGMGGTWPQDRAVVDRTTTVSPAEASALLAALEASGYWTMATDDGVEGDDGSMVFVETVRDGVHRARARWTPEDDSTARGLDKFVAFYTDALQRGGVATAQTVVDPVCARKR